MSEEINSFAPVCLFVYNRPDHTVKVINSLQKNQFCDRTKLFIFSDGPKGDEDIVQVQEVRNKIKNIQGFESVSIKEEAVNIGLAASIINGVTEVIEEYGEVIVLEDDILTSSGFLRYMNSALSHFLNQNEVMHISSYMYPVKNEHLDNYFFLRQASCWGWATWKNRWQLFEKNTNDCISSFSKDMIHEFNLQGTHNFWQQVVDNHCGKINTWAIFWQVTMFLNNGLALHPKFPYSKNIGTDGTGVHVNKTDAFEVSLNEDFTQGFPVKNKVDEAAVNALKKYFLNLKKQRYSAKNIFNYFKRKLSS